MNIQFDRRSSFDYQCAGCGRCCHFFQIQVNPYEVLRLARHLGLTTTDFLDRYLADGPYLRRRDDGACVFLEGNRCGVHPARPLACRLYPLVRHISPQDDEGFSTLPPVPESAGRFYTQGTVGAYLRQQGAEEYMAAADRYLRCFRRLDAALAGMRVKAEANDDGSALEDGQILQSRGNLLDPDGMVTRYCAATGSRVPNDLEAMAALHIEAIEAWLDTFIQESEK
jgi:uncharacterized protein